MGTADEIDMITIARVRKMARPILPFDGWKSAVLNLLRVLMQLSPEKYDDWFDDCVDTARTLKTRP
jgi:predicted Rossmann-fold nucleotide-binding protein